MIDLPKTREAIEAEKKKPTIEERMITLENVVAELALMEE